MYITVPCLVLSALFFFFLYTNKIGNLDEHYIKKPVQFEDFDTTHLILYKNINTTNLSQLAKHGIIQSIFKESSLVIVHLYGTKEEQEQHIKDLKKDSNIISIEEPSTYYLE